MNYIKCPNCNKQISDKSTSCIYCGVTKGTIEQELKANEIKKQKEFISQAEGFFHNNKGKIVALEVLTIISLGIIYAVSYLPKIMEYTQRERLINKIEKCESYGGTWVSDSSLCTTEFGVITIK